MYIKKTYVLEIELFNIDMYNVPLNGILRKTYQVNINE